MSSSIIIDPSAIAFLRSDGTTTEMEPQEVAPVVDTAKIEADVRKRLEQEYQRKLEQQLQSQLAIERSSFDELLKKTVAEFDEIITSLRREIQISVINLSIQLSEIIIRHDLPDREMLKNVIMKILEPISDLQGVRIRISSADWEAFGGKVKVGEDRGVGETVEFLEDPNLHTGDVIVESRNGIFDARLNERMKLLKETLSERISGKSKQPSED